VVETDNWCDGCDLLNETKYRFKDHCRLLCTFSCDLLLFNDIQPGSGLYIRAEELPDEPDNLVEFLHNELEKYPYIQKAFSSPGNEIKVPYENEDVMKNIDDFGKMLQSNDTMFLKVDNKYHNIHLNGRIEMMR